jgi:hypothetical protein
MAAVESVLLTQTIPVRIRLKSGASMCFARTVWLPVVRSPSEYGVIRKWAESPAPALGSHSIRAMV